MYSFRDYLDGECSTKQYRSQFEPPVIQVGHIYVQAKGTWHESHWKVLFIDSNAAMAKKVFCKITGKPTEDYDLFRVDDGWRFNDIRDAYRLSEDLTLVTKNMERESC